MPDVRVLLVEDNPHDVHFIRSCLRGEGYLLEVVGTLSDGVVSVQQGGPKVVLLDLSLPDSDGLHTFETLHRAADPEIAIIVQSGLEAQEIARQAVRMGAQDYLIKDEITEHALLRAMQYAQERKAFERALCASEERYTLAAMGANDGLWDWDLRTNSVTFSPRWTTMLGYRDDAIGPRPEYWLDLVPPGDRDRLVDAIRGHLFGKTSVLECEYRIADHWGALRWMRCRGIAKRDAGGVPYRIAGSQADVSERKEAEARLRRAAFHDALTGLPNRVLFLDLLQQVVFRWQRASEHRFAVLFVDLDRFKRINDSLGHSAGDRVLVEVGRRLQRVVRPADTVARLGGDEFAILLDGIDGLAQAEAASDRLRQQLHAPIDACGHEVVVGASIGIADGDLGYANPADLLRDADIAMYRAKAQGGARHALFCDALQAAASERMALELDLRGALRRQELRLHYQPIYSLRSGEVVSYEALLRWQNARYAEVPADRVIAVAEDAGIIGDIGAWVFQEACAQAIRWRESGAMARDVSMSVNVSPYQFQGTDFVDSVLEASRHSGMSLENVVLEVTEGAMLEASDHVVGVLETLRSHGARVHMDDFGTGQSSLSYLHRFPVDQIKIDRSFVRGMEGGSHDTEIVRAILGLAHSLKLQVVAEGIETQAQLGQLRELDCDYGQGFLFAPPSAQAV
jgi:diguanylate cyclase (GGDEF)-like protein/PAS domain S-box-containing protein